MNKLVCLIVVGLLYASLGWADSINLDVISRIESNGDPRAFNAKSRASGEYQLTPIVRKEYKLYHHNKLAKDRQMADWYLNVRIPQMLRAYKKPVSTENQLISYNAGISYVRFNKVLPKETVNYLKKYRLLNQGA